MADEQRFTFDLESILKLKRMYDQQAREVGNLKRLLASTRRVQPAAPRLIHFRNDSSEEIPVAACMRVTGATRLGGRFCRTVDKPNSTFARGRFLVNLGHRVKASGGRGLGSFLDAEDGEVLCDATSSTPAFDEECGPTPGQWYLTKNRNGFRILGAVTGSGTSARALVQQRVVTEIRGKPDADIAKGATGTISVWWRNPSTGTWEDSTLNLPDVRALGAALTMTKYCSLAWDSGEWLAGPWEC